MIEVNVINTLTDKFVNISLDDKATVDDLKLKITDIDVTYFGTHDFKNGNNKNIELCIFLSSHFYFKYS